MVPHSNSVFRGEIEIKAKKDSRTNILVLEDDLRDIDRIKKNLLSYGWQVDSVSNSTRFKDAIERKNYDVFVIDYDIKEDRGHKLVGGGEKALDALNEKMGLVPVIIYSGNLKTEIDEKLLIEKGASFILKKGEKGSALSSMIRRITSISDEKIGFAIKKYMENRLGEKTFYMKLLSEDRAKIKGKIYAIVTVEIQRLFDEKSSIYRLKINEKGVIESAELKKT